MLTKRIRFIFQLTMFFASFFTVAKAQTNNGLSAADLSSIIKKCIDLPALQSAYPVDASGNLNQINIVNYPYAFPAEVAITKAGKTVNFISNETFAKSPVDNYFMIRRIQQSGATVNLIGNYFYTLNGAKLNKSLVIAYINNAGNWTITNSTIK